MRREMLSYFCRTKLPILINHVPSIDKNGKHHVDYFSRKKFVEMSPKNKLIELQKKNLCLQCLTPGMKYDEAYMYVMKSLSVLTDTIRDSLRAYMFWFVRHTERNNIVLIN